MAASNRLESLDLRHHLAFVVDRAAGVDVAVALGGLEGRREPLVERVGRLHIVVTIDKHGRLAGGVQPVGIDQRMTLGFDEARVLHSDALELGQERFGGLAAICLVLRQGGDGWNAQQGLEFIEKTGVVLAGIRHCRRRH